MFRTPTKHKVGEFNANIFLNRQLGSPNKETMGMLLSHKKKQNEIMPFAASRMDLETVILREKVRQRQISRASAYMWNLKKKKENKVISKIEISYKCINKIKVTGE